MKIAIIGAGAGGKLAAIGVKKKFPEHEVILIGPESNEPAGLFYYNEIVEGIAEREIEVEYELCGKFDESAFKRYQIKSRGYYDESINISSFDKIGKKEKGYLLNFDFNLSEVEWIKEFCTGICLEGRTYLTTTSGRSVDFDIIFSTIPICDYIKLVFDLDLKDQLKYKPVLIRRLTSDLFDHSQISKIKVYYDLKENSPFYRHCSYYNSDGEIIQMDSEKIYNDSDRIKVELKDCYSVIYPGKILPTNLVWNSSDGKEYRMTPEFIESIFTKNGKIFVKLLGRYARWDYHYLVTDTYRDAINFVSSF